MSLCISIIITLLSLSRISGLTYCVSLRLLRGWRGLPRLLRGWRGLPRLLGGWRGLTWCRGDNSFPFHIILSTLNGVQLIKHKQNKRSPAIL